MSDETVLEHYGKLGMHWGRRSATPSKTRKRPKTKRPIVPSEDHKDKVVLKQKKIAEMSNADLKKLNERLQLERQYKDLTAKDISSGRKFSQDILRDVGKELTKDAVKTVVKTAFKTAFMA